MVFIKLAIAVLLWLVLYSLTPDFGHPAIDGLVVIGLAVAAIALVFWIPLPRRSKLPNNPPG